MRELVSKAKEIFESYLIYLGHSFAFIKDEELNEQISHRKEQCKRCYLNRNGWCSKKRIVIVEVDGKYTSKRGCSCFLAAKYFSEYHLGICPLNKWKK